MVTAKTEQKGRDFREDFEERNGTVTLVHEAEKHFLEDYQTGSVVVYDKDS